MASSDIVDLRPLRPTGLSGMEGCTVGGYVLQKLLGIGGTSAVYLGAKRLSGAEQHFAIKLLACDDPVEASAVFRRECAAQAQLSSHHVARVLDIGSWHAGLYICFELVHGTPIDAFCRLHKLSVRERLSIFHEALTAVSHAHEHDIVHGDLKPAHILIQPDRTVKLIDFGVSHIRHEERTALDGPAQYIDVTPQFASPERLAGRMAPADDVYSLGIVLSLLLEDSSSRCADLTAVLNTARADGAARYPTAVAFACDVRRYLEFRIVSVRRAGPLHTAKLWSRRHRVALAIGLTVATFLIASLSFVFNADRQKYAARQTTNDVMLMVMADVESSMQNDTVSLQDARFRRIVEAVAAVGPSDVSMDTALLIVQMYADAGDVSGNAFGGNLGQWKRAEVLYDRARRILNEALPVDDLRRKVWDASLSRRIADLALVSGAPEAGTSYSQIYDQLRYLYEQGSRKEWIADELVRISQQMGFLEEGRGDMRSAAVQYARAAEWADKLMLENRSAGIVAAAAARQRLGYALWYAGDKVNGARYSTEALTHFRNAMDISPQDRTRRFDYATAILDHLDESAECSTARIRELDKAMGIFESLRAEDGANTQYSRNFAQASVIRADCSLGLRRTYIAQPLLTRAADVLEPLVSVPEPSRYDVHLYAWITFRTPQPARVRSQKALSLAQKAASAADAPSLPPLLDLLARGHAVHGRMMEARAYARRALEAARGAGSPTSEYQGFLDCLNGAYHGTINSGYATDTCRLLTSQELKQKQKDK